MSSNTIDEKIVLNNQKIVPTYIEEFYKQMKYIKTVWDIGYFLDLERG